MTNADIVVAMMTAFQTQDRATAERLVAPDFHFTSPQDDRIDRAAWFERCFPTAGHFADHRMLELIETDEITVLQRYEYELKDGTRYRNVEATTIVDGQLTEVEVYFGGAVGDVRPAPGRS